MQMGDPSSLKVKDGRGGERDVEGDKALWYCKVAVRI